MPAANLAFEGIYNFRDFGAYRAAEGGMVKRGVLFRSGQHHGASDRDLERLGGLGLRVVVDLRSQGERERAPSPRPPNSSMRVLHSILASGHDLAPHERAARKTSTRAEAQAAMIRNYQNFPLDQQLVSILRKYVLVLAEEDGPSLIHCFAGKDRTGFAVAILQTLLGIPYDDIMTEFLLSNRILESSTPLGLTFEDVRKRFGQFLDEDAVATLLGVEQSYLDAAFQVVESQLGSVDRYVSEVLKLPDDIRERLQSRLLEY